jgi:hypothetical protein
LNKDISWRLTLFKLTWIIFLSNNICFVMFKRDI